MERKSPGAGRPRRPKSKFITTRSGRELKVNRSLSDKIKARSEEKALRKAERLRGLPKSRFKRVMWRLNPKRQAKFWFSRDGGIMALKLLGVGIIALFVLTIGIFAYFRKDLPNLKDISGNNIGGSIRYYDRTGQVLLWEDYGAIKRIPVQSKDIPDTMKQATVAIEDRDFYQHRGFDMKGIFRAGLNNVFGSGGTQGGSTITQQLVKLTQDWSKDRSYKRKIKELILAVELERTYTKDEILTGYLNVAPYGGIEYGVEAASENYFHKQAKDLTLDEAAMLASIPKAPLFYSPYSPEFDKKSFTSRQRYVLDQMAQANKITKAQATEAKVVDTTAKVQPRTAKYDNIKAPYFVLAAKRQLLDKYVPSGGDGSAKIGGWKVTTTVDLNLQQIAEEQVQKGLAQIKRQGGDTAAFVAVDVKTGQVVSLVGGVDFNNPTYGQNNYAQLRIPPGSSFKPYDYISLIDSTTNFGAGSVLYDTQAPLEGYPCTNKNNPKTDKGANCLWDYDFRFPGPLTLRYALGGSRNVPAVKAMLITGVDKVIGNAEKMGLTSGYKCYEPGTNDFTKEHETQCYSSSAIGDGAYLHLDEHVNGLATISRQGVYLPETYILKIEDGQGRIKDEWKPPAGKQVIRQDAAYIVSDMLSDPNASYFPAGRKPQRFKGDKGTWKFAMKTGTTNDSKDGLMVGFSTKYAAGVWVGYHTRSVQMSGTMENMTQPIWQGWMQAAHRSAVPEDWPKPPTVQTLPAYVIRNHVGIGSVEPSPAKDIFPSWYKAKNATASKRTIDRVSNKLATDCTPAKARQDLSDIAADSLSGDSFVTGNNANSNATTNQTDDVHQCSDAKPTVTLTVTPLGGAQYRLDGIATAGTHPLSSASFPGTIAFTIDGQPISGCPNSCTVQIDDSGQGSVTFTSTYSGSHDVTATVTDSVLYDGNYTVASNFQTADQGGGNASPLDISNPTNGQNVNAAAISAQWSGGTPNYSLTLNGSAVAGCQNIATTSCAVPLLGPNGTPYSLTVTDSSGKSKTVNFKK